MNPVGKGLNEYSLRVLTGLESRVQGEVRPQRVARALNARIGTPGFIHRAARG